MDIIGDALRQAFMPKHEYETLREEDRVCLRLRRPLLITCVTLIVLAIVVSTSVSLSIVYPSDGWKRPFCSDLRLLPLSINPTVTSVPRDSDLLPRDFFLTDQETVDYFWMVLFLPSAILFLISLVYLLPGIAVAYSAPARHWSLNVVENNYCASRRGGVRCLCILNTMFAVIFGILAVFLGSSLLTLGSSCSLPLFWCYQITSWGLVILLSGTAYFLKRKAAVVLDEGSFRGRNLGLEMLEANSVDITPDVEARVNDGFKAWMGSSFLSSDEEDDDQLDDYLEAPGISQKL